MGNHLDISLIKEFFDKNIVNMDKFSFYINPKLSHILLFNSTTGNKIFINDDGLFHESDQIIDSFHEVNNNKFYLNVASLVSTRSYCKRRQVGAVIVNDSGIISEGFNGTISGFKNECEDDNGNTKPDVLHAESNAILKVAKSNNSTKDCTLYVTTSPCIDCAKLIIQSGITEVVFSDFYRNIDGIMLLLIAGVKIKYLNF